MVAFDEQHLQKRPPFIDNGLGTVIHIHAFTRRQRAGALVLAVDIHHADPATAMWRKIGVMAQVGYVFAGPQGGVHDGLAVFKGYFLAVQSECFFRAHRSYLICAASSSRPVIRLETSSAASRSNAGS